MKKNNIGKLLGIAFVVAIISTGIFYGLFVNKLSSSTAGSGKTLVVAAKNLKPGTLIQTADLKTVPWPADHLPSSAFETVDQVAGNTVFDGIGEGEPVLGAQLASRQSAAGANVPAGMRAVSIHVTDSTGVMGLLRPGQMVDVQVVVNRGKGNDTDLRTALENLKVLSVIAQPEQSSQGQNLPVVTLLASPSQADVLALADSGARVRLTLRNPLDTVVRPRGALSLGTVMRVAGEASPAGVTDTAN